MENKKTIDVLNTLVQINNDRIEGYETASKETKDEELKTFFAGLAKTSQKCNRELIGVISKLNGTATESTKTSGKFFRTWMEVKTALTSNDRKAILNSCEYGEDIAKGTYESVLKEDTDHLNAEQQSMIKAQHALLKADHDKVKSMRDNLVEQD